MAKNEIKESTLENVNGGGFFELAQKTDRLDAQKTDMKQQTDMLIQKTDMFEVMLDQKDEMLEQKSDRLGYLQRNELLSRRTDILRKKGRLKK